MSHVFRTGDIVGLAVQNKQGEKLGKIDDLVIDLKSGDIRYAAIAYGGVAGVGAKLFAVPMQKLTFVMGEPNNRSSRHFEFDVPKDELEKSTGFDNLHWPNVADSKWVPRARRSMPRRRRRTARGGPWRMRRAIRY